jgi:hypothetical protein
MTPPTLRFKPSGIITELDNTSINIAGLQMTLGLKNVTVGIFGETGQVVYKDWINPGGGGCFIATAAYAGSRRGAEVPREVVILQKFRDRYLMHTRWGKACVAMYYNVSPLMASYIAQRPWARAVARAVLKPVVWSVKGLVGS